MLTSLELLTIAILLVSYRFFTSQSAPISLARFNVFTWIFGMDLVLMSAASIFYLDGANIYQHWMFRIIPPGDESFFYAWVAICWALLAMPIGFWLSNRLFKIADPRHFFVGYLDKPFTVNWQPKQRIFFYLCCAFSLASAAYCIDVVGGVPLLEWFTGDAQSMAESRMRFIRDFNGNVFIKNILFLTLTPFLAYVAGSAWLQYPTKTNLVTFAGTFIVALIAVTFGLSKYQLIIFLLGFAYLYVLIRGQIPIRLFASIGGTCFGLLLVTYYFVMEGDPSQLERLWGTIVARITQTQSAGIYLAFQYFPDHGDFTGVRSLSSLVKWIGLDQVERPSRLLMAYIAPEEFAAGRAGYASSLFISEAWGGFGWIGALLSPIYVGFFIKSIFNFFMKLGKSPFVVAYLAMVSLNLGVSVGFNQFLKPVLLGVVGAIVLINELIQSRLETKISHNPGSK